MKDNERCCVKHCRKSKIKDLGLTYLGRWMCDEHWDAQCKGAD